MNLKEETLELEDMVFRTQQFPAMQAFALLAKLIKAVGPALGAMMTALQKNPDTKIEASEELMMAFSELDTDQATKLVPLILKNTFVVSEGKERAFSRVENIDYIFSGRLAMMFKVLWHAIQVNYRDFTPGSDPAAPQAQTRDA